MEPLDLDVIAVVDMLGEASLSGLSINSRKVVHFSVFPCTYVQARLGPQAFSTNTGLGVGSNRVDHLL